MKLTHEQEAELLKSYDRLIWHTVHRFKRKLTSSWDNSQDLYQECAIVLIEHFRKARTEAELKKISIRDMINAMCRYNLSEQAVSVPKRTTDFNKKTHSIEAPIDWDSLENNLMTTSSMDDVDTRITFDSFIGTLPVVDKSIIGYKMAGYSNRETASKMGMTDVQITRHLHSACDAYHQYIQ